jgi:3-oxoacyl-[acyl-carrier-protein] synthase-1
MNRPPRIVITGTGAVCGAGRKIEDIWDALANGRSAVAPLSRWDATGWPVRVAAEVTGVDNRTLVEDRKLHKLILRTDMFGIYAAGAAIQQSGLAAHRDSLDPALAAHFNDRCGVISGSGGGTYQNNYDFFPAFTAVRGDLKNFGAESCSTVNPMWLLRNLPNNVLCHVGIRHNFKGTNACITNQCVGGIMAVAEAAAAIRAGEADRAVAVGHDTPIDAETMLNYSQVGLMSPDALRPFDRRRNGTVFGEGAAAVMLEKAADAEARGAFVVGEFLGSGCVTEATGVLKVRADGDGLSRAIQVALEEAGITPDAVGLIVAHGNGTPASDASEAQAFRHVFGGNLPPVTAFKWAFGHLIAASGILDLTLALKALQEQLAPGIPTLQSVDPEFPWLTVRSHSQPARSDIALVCCRGFGGMNVAVLVRAGTSRSAA